DEELVSDQVLDQVVPGDRVVPTDLAGPVLDAEDSHAHYVVAVANELTQRLLDSLTVLRAHVTHDDLTTQQPSPPPNDQLTCRARCKFFVSRETSKAAPVRCSASFGDFQGTKVST